MNTIEPSENIPEWMRIPSDFVIPEKRPKRDAGPVDFTVLDESQMKGAEMFIEYIEGKSPYDMLVLTGYAGVGKTFLISILTEWLSYAKKKNTAITAPTNKAVDVGREMSAVKSKFLNYSTVHKLLGLKEYYDDYGRLKFMPDSEAAAALDGYDVLVVDETSMLDDFLFGLLVPYVKQNGLRLIFVGDPAQIPPINKLSCIPFNPKEQHKYKMGVITLTEIHRQSDGSAILTLATAIRKNLSNPYMFEEMITSYNDKGGIITLKKDDRASTYDVCKEYFVNNIFSEYTDFMKVISWHKDVVLAVNQKVRQFIYRDTNLPMIMVGEKLLADSPIKDQAGYLIYTTNAEFMVKKVTMDRIEVAPKVFGSVAFTQNVKFYRCLVVGTQLSNPRTYMVEKEIWIIHEDSAQLFNAGLDKVKQAILAVDKFKRFGQWSAFYNARDMFAAVKHNYAITAHKCQGSSYENAMVLDWDIRTSSKLEERNRILYTSVTRPRKYLFIIQ